MSVWWDTPEPLGHRAVEDGISPVPADAYDLFPVGQRVRIIASGVDFAFFHGDETGTVVANHGRYLGIIVQLDVERWEHRWGDARCVVDDGRCPRDHYLIKAKHGFNPNHLLSLRRASDKRLNQGLQGP